MYVRDSYKVTILATSDNTVTYKPYTTEYILGYVNINKTEPVLVYVAYRPPDASYLTQLFTDHLKLYSGDYRSKIIMGDLNGNFLQTSNDATRLRDISSELALKVVDHGPTHFATTPATWIDVILVDCNDTITEQENHTISAL